MAYFMQGIQAAFDYLLDVFVPKEGVKYDAAAGPTVSDLWLLLLKSSGSKS